MLRRDKLRQRKTSFEGKRPSNDETWETAMTYFIPKDGLPGARSPCRTYVLYASVVSVSSIIVITLMHCFSDGPIHSLNFVLPAPRPLKGALLPNRVLSSGDRLLDGVVYGPESFAVHVGQSKTIYSGLKTGNVVEIKIDEHGRMNLSREFHPRSQIDSSLCDGSYSMQAVCGRPLGMRFRKHNSDLLLVADAYFGIYEIDIISAKSKLILKVGRIVKGASDASPLRHLNDLDELDDGRIVLTEPSSKFSDRDCMYAMCEHSGDGRLLLFDQNNDELRVLVDHLQYPNGVQLDKDGRCALFAEMGNLRILKHCFEDSFSNYTVIVDNLPGYPDNIRFTRNGMLWVPLGQVRLENDQWITTHSWLRDITAKMTPAWLFSLIVEWMSAKYGMVVIVEPVSGTIVGSLHDPSGETITSVSEVHEMDDGTLLLGGDSNTFVLKVRQSTHF